MFTGALHPRVCDYTALGGRLQIREAKLDELPCDMSNIDRVSQNPETAPEKMSAVIKKRPRTHMNVMQMYLDRRRILESILRDGKSQELPDKRVVVLGTRRFLLFVIPRRCMAKDLIGLLRKLRHAEGQAIATCVYKSSVMEDLGDTDHVETSLLYSSVFTTKSSKFVFYVPNEACDASIVQLVTQLGADKSLKKD